MSEFSIKEIQIQDQIVLITIKLTNYNLVQEIENINFIMNDFDEIVNGTILSNEVDKSNQQVIYKVLFPLIDRFKQFHDGILKINVKRKFESIDEYYMVIYSLDSWDDYYDEIEEIESYFEDELIEEISDNDLLDKEIIIDDGNLEDREVALDDATDIKSILIEDLDLSVRTYNCLKRAVILTLGDIMNKTLDDMMKVRNLSKKSIEEVQLKVKEYGVDLLKNEVKITTNTEDLMNLICEDVVDESNSSTNTESDYYNIEDLNGYDNSWIHIKLSSYKTMFASNSDKLFAEFQLSYEADTGNILEDLEFYITTNSGSQFKSTGYLTRTGEVPKKIDIWFDKKEHILKIGPAFSIKRTDSIIEDGLRMTMTYKDIKNSYFVRKTYILENSLWWHEELFAIPF